MSIGISIRMARVSVGVRQRVLAESVGVSSNYMSLLENDKRMPSIALLERIEKAVSLRPGTLMGGTSDDQGTAFDMMASLVRTVDLNKEKIVELESHVSLLLAKMGNLEAG